MAASNETTYLDEFHLYSYPIKQVPLFQLFSVATMEFTVSFSLFFNQK